MSRTILICFLLLIMPAFASIDLSYQAPPATVNLQHVAWSSIQKIDQANIGIAGWMPTKADMSDLGPYFAGTREAVQGLNETLTTTQVSFAASENELPISVGNATNATILGESA